MSDPALVLAVLVLYALAWFALVTR